VEPSLLNSTEGDLLAQLQAELAARERRPRPYRRARTDADPAANGHGVNGHGVNGHGADGYGVNGHAAEEPGPNGHGPNGHGTNGHDTNGHGTNGHGNGPPPDVSG
jgi:D-sedoheptulose 7-phosphate isomerase